jgi:hypothetical protein
MDLKLEKKLSLIYTTHIMKGGMHRWTQSYITQTFPGNGPNQKLEPIIHAIVNTFQ